MTHNPALNLAPFGRWTLRDKAAQPRLALRYASMSCILRAVGNDFDIDGFIAKTSLEIDSLWRKGEKRFPKSATSEINRSSGVRGKTRGQEKHGVRSCNQARPR